MANKLCLVQKEMDLKKISKMETKKCKVTVFRQLQTNVYRFRAKCQLKSCPGDNDYSPAE